MFEKILKRSSWTDIVISIVFILFGILVMVKPEQTVGAISIVLGILFIVFGGLKLIEYFTTEDKADAILTIALVSVIIGVLVLFASNYILSVFRVIIGIWIIVAGVMDFQTTLMWKEIKSPYWTVALLLSMLMMFAGILIIVNQGIVMKAVGAIIVLYGVLDIVDRIIFMKKIENYTK